MRCLFLLFVLFTSFAVTGQSQEDDELTFHSAVEWLGRKLNYIYYDPMANKWWLNKFYVNEQKKVTIKNISTDKPRTANLKEKTYLIRTFDIGQINPYNMTIRDIETDQGRIAKGKLLELRTFGGENHIHKTVNGRKASNTSFVHISFPTFMTDSIADYPELVRGKLKEAIIVATKVYATGDLPTDRKLLLEVLTGEFETEEGELLTSEAAFESVRKIEKEGSHDIRFFGFDSIEDAFFLAAISEDGTETEFFDLIDGNQLILKGRRDPSSIIEFETIHTFRMNGETYYRR